jgi:hypothetical protein
VRRLRRRACERSLAASAVQREPDGAVAGGGLQVREQEGGGVCTQSALLMQQLPEASPFRTLSAAGAFA